MIALHDLQQFVVLAEELNFRVAAERLLVSQPTLSQTLQRLERELGTSLIQRSTRKSHLTEAGRALLDGAALLLHDARALQTEVMSVGSGRRRQLRVGAVNPAMRELVPSVLKAVHDTFPDVEISLQPMATFSLTRALREGRLDLAISRTTDVMPGFRGIPLMNDPLVAIVGADHRLAHKGAISIRELDGEDFIMAPRSRNPQFHDELVSLYRRRGCSPERILEVNGLHSQLALIGAGIGISIQSVLYRDTGRDDVVYLPVGERMSIPLQAIIPEEDESEVSALFVDAARHRARELVAGHGGA